MAWKIVEKRLGKAGDQKQQMARQREWDEKYGEGRWEVGYKLDGEFVSREVALEKVYYRSYEVYFEENPEDLKELIETAKTLRNPHARATGGVDLQVPAVLKYLERHHLKLEGDELVDIGSYQGEATHALSIRLSPLQIKSAVNPKMTLEKYWQSQKCLAVWQDQDNYQNLSPQKSQGKKKKSGRNKRNKRRREKGPERYGL